MSKNKIGAGICFTDGESILLIKRSGVGSFAGNWEIPGGSKKEDESDLDAAKRETQEEIGSVPGESFATLHTSDGPYHFAVFFYKVEQPFKAKLSDEHTDWEWVAFRNVDSKKLHPKVKDHFAKYLRKMEGKGFAEWLHLTAML